MNKLMAMTVCLAAVGSAGLGTACGSDDSSGEQHAAGSAQEGGLGGTAGSGTGGSGGGTAGTAGKAGAGGTGGSVAGSGGSSTGGSAGAAGSGVGGSAGGAPSNLWSMGYYATWLASMYPVEEIEWSGMTHLAIAFYLPNQDGSLSILGDHPEVGVNVASAARANGLKVIASLGGADSAPGFRQATAPGTIDTFVTNLVALMDTIGADGFDVDWEPMETTDQAAVIDLANRLRTARPETILTVPVGGQNVNIPEDLSGMVAIAGVYDQLNIMSYGMAGAWQGWKSWHSSALYHQDAATPMSVDSSVQLYLAAGVPAAKLGVGIGFYGLCYTPPVTGPDQDLGGSQISASDQTSSYAVIMSNYYSDSARQWDSLARVPYLSFTTGQGESNCSYISYEDDQSIGEKAAYIRAQGLGGVIEWEINEGYISSAAAGQRSPLLTSIRNHILLGN